MKLNDQNWQSTYQIWQAFRMDLNATRMFVAVVQAGSLSAAAARLGIPLPTLSRRIRDLEQQLKVQLLERSARGAKLTDAGTRLYEHAGRGIEVLLEAEQAVMSDQARLKGRLRLSLPQAFEPWWDLPKEALGAIAAATPVARAANQSALSVSPPPIHHCQDIPRLLPELCPADLADV
ncbi:LysR family transcriptional regulator [Bradyrhizobium sp. Leo170]|uniref:LysR family transcriptional regulator n=1 Tax=Bradyrhizobium sp. Leo170 TaxID=1571199 RepID=UPI001FE01FAF|nr:LysR family transcriptional regulator [Bradyrhizobium sp. Leo170]